MSAQNRLIKLLVCLPAIVVLYFSSLSEIKLVRENFAFGFYFDVIPGAFFVMLALTLIGDYFVILSATQRDSAFDTFSLRTLIVPVAVFVLNIAVFIVAARVWKI